MAAATQQKKKRKLSRLDAIGLVLLVAMVLALLYMVDQRGQQAVGEPSAALPAAVVNAATDGGDAAGRDLNSVPRYPGSRRLLYTEKDAGSGKVYSVIYNTADDLKPVSAYYENEMPKYGWRMVVKSEQALRMDFVRYNATAVIGVPEVTLDFGRSASGGTTIAVIATEPKQQ